MLLSYTIIEFHLCYNGAVDIQIWAPLTRSQCKVSDIQVTVQACGLLVSRSYALFELKNLTKMKNTTQNSLSAQLLWNRSREFRETVVMKDLMCRYAFLQEIWFDLLKEQFISLFNFGQNYFVQLRWNWFSVRLPITNAWNCHMLYTAFSSNVWASGMWACSLFLSSEAEFYISIIHLHVHWI